MVSRRPLHYTDGADAQLDRPRQVRSGSALVRFGDRLAVIQDDAAFVARIDERHGTVEGITLPAGPGGARQFDDTRGNKADKLDLEAAITVGAGIDQALIAFGSGSSLARERVLILDGDARNPRVRVIDAGSLYASLRATLEFSGAELNVEGALVDGPWLRLFNRGNGARRDRLLPLDATCDLELAALRSYLDGRAPPPAPRQVVQYQLGEIAGVRLTFTDATACRAGALFLAAAEDCPDALHDGPVRGIALGVISPEGEPRYTVLQQNEDAPFTLKAEGLCLHAHDPMRAWTVVDQDDPEQPSLLCELVLDGPWFAGAGLHG